MRAIRLNLPKTYIPSRQMHLTFSKQEVKTLQSSISPSANSVGPEAAVPISYVLVLNLTAITVTLVSK